MALKRWNHNIHYGLEVLRQVPPTARDALDVGCGEGWMVRALAERVPRVVGIDPDEASLDEARATSRSDGAHRDGVDYVLGSLLDAPLEPASFDVVTCIATLHHMDEEAGLGRLAALVRPGGFLAVVGLAHGPLPAGLPWELAGMLMTRVHRVGRELWETPAPKVWPPPHTYRELRALSGAILPGSRFRRRAMWRYVLTWTKPQS